ncbi:hypothetical protein CWI75_14330 [Kineobactrum sediminis]|uniref:Sulfotransferase domain-containing protein n=1 Tax=Kineobactrum sediminis TaxID=1905677 RepID=A0A2N5XZU1_9GAMM|nr:hypothetical protein [Kineobactrum sediminis]PLW81643.1 hypothetical protein CWI75_14330 [Kineobactrum sediminis]
MSTSTESHKPPLIHIGMPKAASTWLQQRFFRPEHGYKLCYGPLAAHLAFISPRPFCWTPPTNTGVEKAGSLTPVISCEALSGDPLSGGADGEMILARLHQALPDARILIVIREQIDMLRSLYQLLVNWGYPYKLDLLANNTLSAKAPRFEPAFLCYDRIIKAYQDAFGHHKVLVLSFEEFRSQPLIFLNKLNLFCGVESPPHAPQPAVHERINSKRDLFSLELKRLYNRHIARTVFDMGGFYSPARIQAAGNVSLPAPRILTDIYERRFSQRARSLIGPLYEESNLNTEQLTGLPLGALGYIKGSR